MIAMGLCGAGAYFSVHAVAHLAPGAANLALADELHRHLEPGGRVLGHCPVAMDEHHSE